MSTNDKPNRHDQIRAASFFPPSKCSACDANVAHWIDRAAGRAACNGCGALVDLPAMVGDKPGILSAPPVAEARAALDAFDSLPFASEAQDHAAYDCARALAALLAHIDAIAPPPGEVDAEALGRAAWCAYRKERNFQLVGCAAWEDRPDDEREAFAAAAVAAHAIGYAAGLLAPRPPGAPCADCATLCARADGLERQVAWWTRHSTEVGDRLNKMTDERDRLTAELAEARAAIRRELAAEREGTASDLAVLERRHNAAVEQARAEGAREEREAIRALLIRAADRIDEAAEMDAVDENGIRDPEARALAAQLRARGAR